MASSSSFAERLKRGDLLFGTCVISTSPHFAVATSKTGCDFVFIDTEHIPIDREKLSWMCRTYSALGMPPIVRVPEPEPYRACSHLDGGAEGIVFPYVESLAELQSLVGAVKLKPIKGQRLATLLSDPHAHLSPSPLAAALSPNASLAAIANIESRAALDNLDALLAGAPLLDAVLVGPHDLSLSLDVPCDWGNHVFHEAINTIITKARAHGLGVGVHYSFDRAVDYQEQWMSRGANFIVHSSDMVLYANSLRTDLARLRATAGAATRAAPVGAEPVV